MQTLIQGDDILDLIPQRPPIVMIDKFYGIKDNISYSGLTIDEKNILFDNDHFSEAGLIEHIAQSAAARIGYLCHQQQISVPIGFIGSVDKMKFYELPSVGDELETEITVMQEVDVITLISAIVKVKENIIAECRMKIFINK